MTSLWHAYSTGIDTDAAAPDSSDVVVVGAGLAGLTTALLLSRAGVSVTVLEARTIGAVTTGNTTGKVSLLQGAALQGIAEHNDAQVVGAYVTANRAGQAWLRQYLGTIGAEERDRDAWSIAFTQQGRETLERELEVAREAGLDVDWAETTELPFTTTGGIRLAGQFQIDPMPVLAAMVRELRERGAAVVQNARVTEFEVDGDRVRVTLHGHEVSASRVVIATGMPVTFRGAYFARLEPNRSYASAYRVPGPLPQAMYLSVDSPSRSLRTATFGDQQFLVAGGPGHIVGRERSPKRLVEELDAWVKQHFPGAVREYTWSAQDYRALDHAPYVGRATPGDERIYVATGFNKWGMANSVAAALTLSARLSGAAAPDWATALYDRPTTLPDAAEAVRVNATVGGNLAKEWAMTLFKAAPDAALAEGEGRVFGEGLHPRGRSVVDGVATEVSAVCTHLGGILSWNDAECTWDCPLHGSRFAADGSRLEGPAVKDLGH
ncbi:FAD-dependent oxidoreductase [Ruicaihuangia caeni]|uniref:FAD-dependent oxidoreductase n=1 Tax=Ruicaihuangia caeni TaxID=3042517 RepID=UPI00338D69D1